MTRLRALKKGDFLTDLELSPLTRVQISRLMTGFNDFNPLYVDHEIAQNAGYGGVCAPVLTGLGAAEHQISQTPGISVVSELTGTFLKLIYPGDRLTLKSEVVKKFSKNGEPHLNIAIKAINQNNHVVMEGTAVCKTCPIIKT